MRAGLPGWCGLGRRWMSLALAALLLAACGGPAPTGTPGPAATSVPSTRPPGTAVRFMVYGDPLELQAYQALLAAYQQANPAANVELIPVASQADYEHRLAADFTAGTPADVVLVNYRRLSEFDSRGLLTPVGPYLAHSSVLTTSAFYFSALTPYYHGRTLVCLPQSASGLVIYYNRALFDQAGLAYPDAHWSWDTFLAAAQALTQDTNADGQTDIYGFGAEVSLASVVSFFWQAQGNLVDNVLLPRGLELNTPPGTIGIKWFTGLQVTHHVAPDAAAEAAESSESRFLNGRLGMTLNSRQGVPAYRAVPSLDWDVAPVPSYKGRHTNLLSSDGYCLTTGADPATAWPLLEFAASPAGQTLLAGTGRLQPALVGAAESPAFLDPATRPEHDQVFLDALDSAWPMPPHPNWNEIEDIVDDEVKRAFYGQATVSDALAAAVARTEEYFKLHR
jgi:multiple sugar transport system substrate-binding protein